MNIKQWGMQMRRRAMTPEVRSKRGGVCGGSAIISGHSVRAQLLAGSIPKGLTEYRISHPENGESRSATNAVFEYDLSPWTRSIAKRAMDIGIVLIFSPILVPLLAVVALVVLLTSGAPIVFRQQRIGRNGAPFVIYKFRTMRPAPVRPLSAIAIESANRITWLGAFLRKSKLDELPQVFNVLSGEMSLVGPRPKVAEQEPTPMPCRPGLTGAATLAFAREEMILQDIAPADVNEYYHKIILNAKRTLDTNYLRHATFVSDIWILVNTLIGRWESHTWKAPRLQDGQSKKVHNEPPVI